MNVFLTLSCAAALLLASSHALAGKGPKGGPSFTDYEWTEVRETVFGDDTHWEPRAGLQSVELHNHLFVIAGRTPAPVIGNPFASIIHGDVWVSEDRGETWYELLSDAESQGLWRNRAYFEAVTMGSHMYLMGGQNFKSFPEFSDFFSDVWRSADGVNWEQMTADAPWAGRAGLSAVSFKGKLWVMGGSQGDDLSIIGIPDNRVLFNDVWYSEDGVEWHEATAGMDPGSRWSERAGAAVLVKGGWIYILGGEKGFTGEDDYFNDVWRSKDGANWEEVTGEDGAGWSKRPGHKCAVLANHMVCMGGFAALDPFPPNFDTNPSDIWVSKDGANWEQVSASPWNNDPSYSECIFANPPLLPIFCDDVRYDFDILAVKGGKGGMKPSIFTFGGDREIFVPIPGNEMRIENDVWRYGPAE